LSENIALEKPTSSFKGSTYLGLIVNVKYEPLSLPLMIKVCRPACCGSFASFSNEISVRCFGDALVGEDAIFLISEVGQGSRSFGASPVSSPPRRTSLQPVRELLFRRGLPSSNSRASSQSLPITINSAIFVFFVFYPSEQLLAHLGITEGIKCIASGCGSFLATAYQPSPRL